MSGFGGKKFIKRRYGGEGARRGVGECMGEIWERGKKTEKEEKTNREKE